MRFLHPTEKAHLCMRSHERGEAQTSHRRWHIVDMQAKGEAERSLEPAAAKAKVPRRVGCGKSPQVGTCPLDTHDAPFFASGAVFFSAEPTFFPRSGFFFGRRGM